MDLMEALNYLSGGLNFVLGRQEFMLKALIGLTSISVINTAAIAWIYFRGTRKSFCQCPRGKIKK